MINFKLSAFADEICADFEGQLEALNKLNIGMIELRMVDGRNFTVLSDDEIYHVKSLLEKYKIGISALASPIGKFTHGEDFEAHKALLVRVMEIGDILDCKIIRMFSFYRSPNMTDIEFETETFEKINELLDIADSRGYKLCHENEKDIYGCDIDFEKKLLDFCGGRLRAVLDPGNFAFCRYTLDMAYEKLGTYIDYMHIKDADENGTIVPPGMGVAKLSEILSQIKNDNSRDGDFILTLEPHLIMFTGLSSLSNTDDIVHKYSFETPFAAFDTATNNLLGILSEI